MNCRDRVSLDGVWRFLPDPHADGETLGFWRPGYSPRLWCETPVPGCFEAAGPSLERYTGIVWYRRSFRVPEAWTGKRVILHFEGVNYRARVWLNGRFLGENLDGFLPFGWDIRDYIGHAEEQVLVVQVDNAPHQEDVPGQHVQWRGFGGILREVFLYSTPLVFIENIRVKAAPEGEDGIVELNVSLNNCTHQHAERLLEATIRDARGTTVAALGPINVGMEANSTLKATLSGVARNAAAWSPDSPALYTATVSLRSEDALTDESMLRFGFRRIEATPNGLRLNGQPVFLTGFNRHEDSPRTAMAADPETARHDFQRMKEAGANFVRLCHYPHHPHDLDLCDEIGLMVMDEIPLNLIIDPARAATAERQLEQMILRDEHHPSVIFWSVSNETNEEEPFAAEANRTLIRKARSLNPSRLCVHVSHRWQTHPNFAEDDVICINNYPSITWEKRIGCSPAHDLNTSVNKWRNDLEALHQQHPSKPILVTECGYMSMAGTFGHALGEDLHERVITTELAALDQPYLCGSIIWCWADHPWPPPGFLGGLGMSPFGVLRRDRRPKKAFQAAQNVFRAKQGIANAANMPDTGTSIIMTRPHFRDLPDVVFPNGYGIRPMTLQDVGLWTDITRDAEPYLTIKDTLFMEEFGSDTAAVPRRCFIMTDSRGLGVGAISAWYNRDFRGHDAGRIHWLAVRPAHQGKGLGRAGLAFALRLLSAWHEQCYLVTSTQRVNAVRLYLNAGFEPDLPAPRAKKLWRTLA